MKEEVILMHKINTRTITYMASIAAIAFTLAAVGNFPIVPAADFLRFEFKDTVLIIGGFVFGPVAASVIAVVVALAEMISFSQSWFMGFVMNAVSSCALVFTASFVYRLNRSILGAVLGLMAGVATMTVAMMLMNYFITPIYMGIPRHIVADMLIPVFLPFNLLKGGLNATVAMILYKPVVTALRNAKLLPASAMPEANSKLSKWLILASLLIYVTCTVFVFLMWNVF
jgi:riboflavin transporter FmnP